MAKRKCRPVRVSRMRIERYSGGVMKKMFLLFSHQLNDAQKEQAKNEFGIEEFVTFSDELRQIWMQIDPDLSSLEELLQPVRSFLKENAKKGDYALIQGDFGAVYAMVNYAKKLKVVPVYATTKRSVTEISDENGKVVKKSIFEHRRFREYE